MSRHKVFDRVFAGGPERGGFRVNRSSGTSDPAEFRRRDEFLTWLWETGREAHLRAFKAGDVTLEELMALRQQGKLGYSPAELKVRHGLWAMWERAIDEMPEITDATRVRYRTAMRQLRNLGELGEGATVRDLETVRWGRLQREWNGSPASWNHIRRALGKFLSHEFGKFSDVRRGIMERMPLLRETPYVVDAGQDYVYLQRALNQVWQSGRKDLYRVYVTLLVTGLRVGEYLRLTKGDLVPEVHSIVVRPTGQGEGRIKNAQSARIVSVPPEYWEAVEKSVPYPVATGHGKAYWWLREVWVRACDEAGVPRIKLHGLRHLKIRMALDGGAELTNVMQEVGHKRVQQTAEYALSGKRRPEVALAMTGQLAGVLAPKERTQ